MATPDLLNPTADDAVPKLGWQQVIEEYHYQMQMCAVTEDFSYCSALRLQESTLKIDYVAILETVAPEEAEGIRNDLVDTLVANVSIFSDSFDALTKTVNGIQADSDPDQPDWMTKINADAENQKRATAAAIDYAKDMAISIIEAAPPEAQNAAANIYLRGMTIVSSVLQAFTKGISRVLSKIGEFEQGIFWGLTIATNWVKSAAEGATNVLNIILGPGGGCSVDESEYVANIAWPATVKFTTAALALGQIEHYLAHRRYKFSVEDLKKDTTAVTATVTFGPRNPGVARRKRAPVSLKKVWQQAVLDVDEDARPSILPGEKTVEPVKSKAAVLNGS